MHNPITPCIHVQADIIIIAFTITMHMHAYNVYSVPSLIVLYDHSYAYAHIHVYSVLSSNISNYTCERLWDGRKYFSFILHITVPPNWARTNVITEFLIEPRRPNGTHHSTLHIPVEVRVMWGVANSLNQVLCVTENCVWIMG